MEENKTLLENLEEMDIVVDEVSKTSNGKLLLGLAVGGALVVTSLVVTKYSTKMASKMVEKLRRKKAEKDEIDLQVNENEEE